MKYDESCRRVKLLGQWEHARTREKANRTKRWGGEMGYRILGKIGDDTSSVDEGVGVKTSTPLTKFSEDP